MSELDSLLDPIPAPVAHLDATALEWQPLLALVANYAVSRVGREGLLAFSPSTEQSWIEQQHQLIAELRTLMNSGVTIPLGGLFDPTQLAAKSQIPEAALEPAELQSVTRLANDIGAWQSLLRNPPASAAASIASLQELSAVLTQSLSPLAESIQRKLLPDGTLADDASPELSRGHPRRPHHYPRRPLRHPRQGRAETTRFRRSPRS
jgi:DNA mismatch repair protein MutS2